MQFNLIQVRSS